MRNSIENQSSELPENKEKAESFELSKVKLEDGPKQILKAPRQERPKKLQEFKDGLFQRKEGAATMQVELTNLIFEKPDTPIEELKAKVADYFQQNNLPEEQERIAENILTEYVRKQDVIKFYREQFLDDRELYKAVFGVTPAGKIEIIESPVGFYVRIFDIKDFAYVYYGSFNNFEFKDKNKKITEKGIEDVKNTGGKALHGCLIPEIGSFLIVKNTSMIEERPDRESFFKHEIQHKINDLFLNEIQREEGLAYEKERAMKQKLKLSKNDSERESIMSRLLRSIRIRYVDFEVKKEAIAYFKGKAEREFDFFDDWHNFLKGKAPGIYNISRKAWMNGEADGLISILGEDKRDLIGKVVEEIFVEENDYILNETMENIIKLQMVGYSNDEIVAILMQEEFSNWPKAIRRILEWKKKNNLIQR